MRAIDWKSVVRGGSIAASGAVLAYFSACVIPALQASADPCALALGAVMSVLVNAGRKWLDA